ncbi:MAG: exopolyphosphatase / guanosine-5-triphosphate,3-diphosphate pyrophosphatase, partial [Thermoleophilaceae bacterium]|nr:exopolyphosphatase / guanosine-5-triphosphate,3-diphosphate pyrophosphatase [Thermoleophilaceae bacterium]
GTNTTRVLVADVENGCVSELERQTTVTRLGEGVDSTNRLADTAIERVTKVLDGYKAVIDELQPERVIALATSATRDAENGDEFRAMLHDRYGFDARIIPGEEEARLTFLGATARRPQGDGPFVVIDIGGGSTEYVVGSAGDDPAFRVSTQAGSVRQTERHLHEDPPSEEDLATLQTSIRSIVADAVPTEVRTGVSKGIAVAGTATSLAAIDQQLDPYDPAKVDGYGLLLEACDRMLGELASVPLEERRQTTGLHPDRAPTIIAGAAILVESMKLFELESIEVSEADILHGAALDLVARQV